MNENVSVKTGIYSTTPPTQLVTGNYQINCFFITFLENGVHRVACGLIIKCKYLIPRKMLNMIREVCWNGRGSLPGDAERGHWSWMTHFPVNIRIRLKCWWRDKAG